MLFYVGVAGYPQVLKKYQIVNISRRFFQLFYSKSIISMCQLVRHSVGQSTSLSVDFFYSRGLLMLCLLFK